jgi:hypothetical protein
MARCGVPPDGDLRLAARVRVGFRDTYDAGVLLIWAAGGDTIWPRVARVGGAWAFHARLDEPDAPWQMVQITFTPGRLADLRSGE